MSHMANISLEIPELAELIKHFKTLADRVDKIEGKHLVSKNYYSIKEAAVYLNLSEKSVRRLIERKLITASRGTRHYRLSRETLEDYKTKAARF